MTVGGVLLFIVVLQAVAIAALLLQRRGRALAERTLRDNEQRLHDVLDGSPLMVWTARPDVSLDYLNGRCAEFTGFPMEKLHAEGWMDALHPDYVVPVQQVIESAIATRGPILTEYRLRRADGVYRWLMATGLPRHGPDGAFLGWVGCDVDITERKEAEARIGESRAALEASNREIQHLAGRLIEAQDTERARIARELHDDVSQQLAGLSIALSGLRQRLKGAPLSDGQWTDLAALQHRATGLAQSVRHLSHDLHPTVLRHAGLVASLTSYSAELQRTHGTAIACDVEGDIADLSAEVALCLYRIAQEALRNAVTHAGARRADVRLSRIGDDVEITITDNGKGFDVESSIERGKGLGLVSIVERTRVAGGTFGVVSEPSKGTTVRVKVPAGSGRSGVTA